MSERILLRRTIDIHEALLGKTVAEAIVELKKLRLTLPDEVATTARIESDYEEFILEYQSLETDDEYEARMEDKRRHERRMEESKRRHEEHERQQYERLKAKFEGQ